MSRILAPPRTLQLILAPTGSVDPNAYHVLRSLELSCDGLELALYVIGASSLVRVVAPVGDFTEVIACEGAPAPAETLGTARLRVGAGAAAASLAVARPAFGYRVRLWTAALDAVPPEPPLPHLLEHRFPGPDRPLTRIEAAPARGGLRLRTRHDYPECGLAVWSESDWTM